MLTVTGKKVRYAAITAFDTHEVPSHTTTIGAIARIGTVWDTITYGSRPRSSSRKRAKSTARASPVTAPSAKPIRASSAVYAALWAMIRSQGVPSAPSRRNSARISWTCGSL